MEDHDVRAIVASDGRVNTKRNSWRKHALMARCIVGLVSDTMLCGSAKNFDPVRSLQKDITKKSERMCRVKTSTTSSGNQLLLSGTSFPEQQRNNFANQRKSWTHDNQKRSQKRRICMSMFDDIQWNKKNCHEQAVRNAIEMFLICATVFDKVIGVPAVFRSERKWDTTADKIVFFFC